MDSICLTKDRDDKTQLLVADAQFVSQYEVDLRNITMTPALKIQYTLGYSDPEPGTTKLVCPQGNFYLGNRFLNVFTTLGSSVETSLDRFFLHQNGPIDVLYARS